MPADIDAALDAAVTTPASFSEEGRSETARSVDDVIKLDQHAAAKVARARRRRGMAFSKYVPAGPMADNGGTCSGTMPFGGGCC